MAEQVGSSMPMTRTFFVVAAVFALLYLFGTSDLLLDVTRPLVVIVLGMAGISAQNTADVLIAGTIRIPWTRDCAGVNILILLWAIALWANRSEPFSRGSWTRLLLVVPAALAANTCRVLTLVIYRYIFYPSVESQQFHYFIGFLWLIPCLPFFMPRGVRGPAVYLLETLFLASALALLTPFVSAPGGILVTLASLLLVARSRWNPIPTDLGGVMIPWCLAPIFIALASMESLWLPWLLVCPLFWEAFPQRTAGRLALSLGTIPLLAMDSAGRWFVGAAVAWEGWMLLRNGRECIRETHDEAPLAFQPGVLTVIGMILALVFPFLASAANGFWKPSLCPPSGTMSRIMTANAYDIRLVAQPPDMHLVWYGPSGDGRHHTLPVCMNYRGVKVWPSGSVPTVMTDGKSWMREFFIHRRELLPDYVTYLRRTIWPWSSAGVHLIFNAPVESMSAERFAQKAHSLALELNSLGEPVPITSSGSRAPQPGPSLSPAEFPAHQ